MAKVTNTARGARGIRDKGGNVVMIEPGQSVEGEFESSEVSDFKAMLKAESGAAPANESDADDDDDDDGADTGPLSGSVTSLKEHLATVDDLAALERLGKDEAAGKNRSGALDAIQARIDELNKPAE